MTEIYNNKTAFLRMAMFPFHYLIAFLVLIFLIVIILMFKIEIYDTYPTKGIVSCQTNCVVTTYIPTSIKDFTIRVANEEVNFQIMEEEIKTDEENMISYNYLKINISGDFKDKEIIDLTFHYNKQRIITKLKERIFN